MKYLLLIIAVFVSEAMVAQPPHMTIDSAVVELDRALLAKDSLRLKGLLGDEITYGHSNGWIQTKRDVIEDLFNGKITYKQISAADKEIKVSRKVAVVRMNADVDVTVSGTPVHVKLKILQVWQKRHFSWHLIARQSVKI